jgi:proline iminopeptidase
MPAPFPPIEPFDSGFLDTGDGQRVYWETSGNPNGTPVLALHGGPGSGSTVGRRRWFDPQAYLLVQFDQRGCGRSTPSVAEPFTDLSTNTTHHLIADIEHLREHLGIERWVVWGASWGVTLGLAYAERFPARVRAMVLVSVTVSRREDIRWLYHDAGKFFPGEWARFRDGASVVTGPDGAFDDEIDLVAVYDHLLNDHPSAEVRAMAARHWCAWEDAVVSLEEGWEPNPRYEDPAFRMTFARLCAHYFSHGAWLEEGELLRNAGRLASIPGVLIHGRFDIGGPPHVPWLLARAWPDAKLHLVRTGHTGGDEMNDRMLEALARFSR